VIDLLEKASQPNITDEERRRMLTFVVVGAGPTGVEYCGELRDFLADVTGKTKESKSLLARGQSRPSGGIRRSVAPFANLLDLSRIVLVQGAKDVLPQFDERLRQSARKQLEDQGIEVLTSTRVTSIENKERLVISKEVKEGQRVDEPIDCGLIVWAGGTQPVKLTEKLISNVDKYCEGEQTFDGNSKKKIVEEDNAETKISPLSVNGRIPVDKWLRVLGTRGNVLAMGDAAVTVGKGTTILPQTAQVAAQQGAYVARLLNRGYDLNPNISEKKMENEASKISISGPSKKKSSLYLKPPKLKETSDRDFLSQMRFGEASEAKGFEFLNLGMLAYIGGGEALSQVQLGDNQLFNQAGSTGFLLWRSVYIVKQVSTKTRLLVLFDWFKTRIFGRDVTRT